MYVRRHFQRSRLAHVILAAARVARNARPLKIGTLRPAIVLYDEPHPLGDDIGLIQAADVSRKPDLLIIMGTSLKVHGLKKLVKDFARVVRTSSSGSASTSKINAGKVIFVNMTAPASEWHDIIDYHVAGATDAWSERVLQDWKTRRPADWQIQKTLDPNSFKAIKENLVPSECMTPLRLRWALGADRNIISLQEVEV